MVHETGQSDGRSLVHRHLLSFSFDGWPLGGAVCRRCFLALEITKTYRLKFTYSYRLVLNSEPNKGRISKLSRSREIRNRGQNESFKFLKLQCSGSLTFWYGSGSAGPYHWLMDPDPVSVPGPASDPDPALFAKVAFKIRHNKKEVIFFLLITFWRQICSLKEVTKQ